VEYTPDAAGKREKMQAVKVGHWVVAIAANEKVPARRVGWPALL
jgi:hypothetical protein